MVKCSVPFCTSDNSLLPPQDKIKMYKFPTTVEEQDLWLQACNLPLDFNFNKALVCSKHFNFEDLHSKKCKALGIAGNESCKCSVQAGVLPSMKIKSAVRNVPKKKIFRPCTVKLPTNEQPIELVISDNDEDDEPPSKKLSKRCRLCACSTSSDETVPLFGVEGVEKLLRDKINQCLPIKVAADDTLPLVACRSCLNQLEVCVALNIKCLRADKELRSLLDVGPTEPPPLTTINVTKFSSVGPDIEPSASSVTPTLSFPSLESNIFGTFTPVVLSNPPLVNLTVAEMSPITDVPYQLILPTTNPDSNTLPSSTENISIKCTRCEESFPNHKLFVKHSNSNHKTFLCNKCPTVKCTSHYELQQHWKTHADNDKVHLCYTCGESYTKFTHLRKHTRTHARKKDFDCDVCGESCFNAVHLSRHKSIHLGSSLQCSQCKRWFSNLDNLKSHIDTKHSPQWTYQCTVCKFTCRNNDDMLTHSTTHVVDDSVLYFTRTSPFYCGECRIYFPFQFDMFRHNTMIHQNKLVQKKTYDRNVSSEKCPDPKAHTDKLKCDSCSQDFLSEQELLAHFIQEHSTITCCELCNEVFASQENLLEHMKTTHGLLPVEGWFCSQCGAEFGNEEELQKHIDSHNNEVSVEESPILVVEVLAIENKGQERIVPSDGAN